MQSRTRRTVCSFPLGTRTSHLVLDEKQTVKGTTTFLVGDFSGCPAGPGYHAYLIQLIDVFVARSGLDIRMVDATGYYGHRDFAGASVGL